MRAGRAGKAGDRQACERLITLYENGLGVPQSAELAAFWREKAEEGRLTRKQAFLERARKRRAEKAAKEEEARREADKNQEENSRPE